MSADSRPHFMTIAEFISSMSDQIERSAKMLLDRHKTLDANAGEPGQREREEKTIRALSAKIPSSHGVIQGY